MDNEKTIVKIADHEKNSEKLLVALLLAGVGGFLDVYTYITRGEVFANAQTGNMVLMAISFAETKFLKGFSYIIPIICFAVGVFIVQIVKTMHKNNKIIHYRHIVVAIEIIIITLISFITSQELNILVNSIVSLISGMQMQCFRKLDGNPYTTTMCTGNLRSMGDYFSKYLKTKEKKFLKISLYYLFVILSFIISAFIGYLLTNLFKTYSILFCNIALILVLILLSIKKINKSEKNMEI